MPPQTISDIPTQLTALLPLAVSYGLRALEAIVIVLVGLWLAGRAHRLALRGLDRMPQLDEMLRHFFGSAVRYLVLTVTVLAVLQEFGIQTTSFAAVLGATALAVGLALQGTLSHLAAGVMLLIFRPFRIGHRIQVGGVTGEVRDLTLFWTELITDDKVQVIVPNGAVWGQQLRNYNVYPSPAASAQARFRIAEESAVGDALARVRSVVEAQPYVLKDPVPSVLLDRSGPDNALEVVVTFSTDGAAAAAKSDLIKAVHEALRAEASRRAAAEPHWRRPASA